MSALLVGVLGGLGVHLLYTGTVLGWRGIAPGPRIDVRTRCMPDLHNWLRQAGLEDLDSKEFLAVISALFGLGLVLGYMMFGGLLPPLIIAARSRQDADDLDHIPADAQLIMTGGDDRVLLDRLDEQDLLIAPAHVLRNRSPLAERRLTRRLQNMNVVLVGGPHRLVFSTSASRPKPIAAPMSSSAIR